MTCATAGLGLNPGGDFASTVTLTDESGAVIDATGYTASIVDPTGEVGAAVTATLTDAPNGQLRLQAVWQGAWAATARQLGTARLSLVNGPDEIVSRPFPVSVAGPAVRLVVARGADMAYRFQWPDDRDGADLTGETLDVINASATLAPLASVVVIDAATRECELRIEGDLATPLGEAGTLQVRRRVAGINPRALAPIAVSFR